MYIQGFFYFLTTGIFKWIKNLHALVCPTQENLKPPPKQLTIYIVTIFRREQNISRIEKTKELHLYLLAA